MIFGTTATHALSALAALAADESGEAVLGRDLAARIGVPAHYLSKVLVVLARAGILSASRGARGGYWLARDPAEVTLLEIVEPFEGKRVRPGCLLQPDRPCRDEGACSAHGAWTDMKKAYSRFLETTRLADIRGGVPDPKPPRARGRARHLRRRAAGPPPGRSSRVRRSL